MTVTGDPVINAILPPVGEVVHVAGSRGECKAAIVMGSYPDESLWLRVIERTPATEDAGNRDSEGLYHPQWAPTYVSNPDGSQRALDSWHWRYHA